MLCRLGCCCYPVTTGYELMHHPEAGEARSSYIARRLCRRTIVLALHTVVASLKRTVEQQQNVVRRQALDNLNRQKCGAGSSDENLSAFGSVWTTVDADPQVIVNPASHDRRRRLTTSLAIVVRNCRREAASAPRRVSGEAARRKPG
jgi:hypothetical protein